MTSLFETYAYLCYCKSIQVGVTLKGQHFPGSSKCEHKCKKTARAFAVLDFLISLVRWVYNIFHSTPI